MLCDRIHTLEPPVPQGMASYFCMILAEKRKGFTSRRDIIFGAAHLHVAANSESIEVQRFATDRSVVTLLKLAKIPPDRYTLHHQLFLSLDGG